MNANNSFRTSITILTVATIVGCVVILFSGLSQFQLRSSGHEKALVSSADQKLRNRFGEFYPVERRGPVAEPGAVESPTSNTSHGVIHSASHRSTFDEIVTTTSDYDTSEVVTSWSSGASAATPQVSVPVTINVNNGELMATLIETREKLAEMKAQQSSTRDEQRVFSYQVHKSGVNPVVTSGVDTAAGESPEIRATHSKSQSQNSEGSTTPPARANADARAAKTPSPAVRIPELSAEEEVSFEPVAAPPKPAAEDSATVPVIEPISYQFEGNADESTSAAISTQVTETVGTTQSATVVEESVIKETNVKETIESETVQFAPWEEITTKSEPPASLPDLSFEQSLGKKSSDVPELSADRQATVDETLNSNASPDNSGVTPVEPDRLDFFPVEENTTTEQASVYDRRPRKSSANGSTRTREELSGAFAAVRGLPPEDLFNDRTSAFVTPIAPAEPAPEATPPEIGLEDSNLVSSSASKAVSAVDGDVPATPPPTISFIESAGDRLVVHPSSAAAPLDLEFGEHSAPVAASTRNDARGNPDAPRMPPVEPQPERWHKYRSRVYRKQGVSPSTPVPPVPEVAVSDRGKPSGSLFTEPALVPPAVDDSLAESGLNGSDIGNSIMDSPLMIPDEDGTTEVAQGGDSEKLSSSSLPPIPELAPVPELPFNTNEPPADQSLVYEPQPVMERIHEFDSEFNTPPMLSASPTMKHRRMPQKSANDLPFATTFRRINKRVAWMADAICPSEKKTAQHSPKTSGSHVIKRDPPRSAGATQKHGPAVAGKSSPSQPMQLPKLTLPKFTVQNFSLPKVNFKSIPAPSFQMPMLDTPDWLACPPDVLAPVRSSTAVHRVISTMQFAGQPNVVE